LADKFKIKPLKDIPTPDAALLGHDKVVENLKKFLQSDEIETPMSIAIHGEWGSGKTSIMRTLEKKLDKEKVEFLFFEAWKYEYSNPSAGLIGELAIKLSDSRDSVIPIVKAAAFVLTKQFLNFDSNELMNVLQKDRKTLTENLSENLQKIIENKIKGKKLVILIDDLDRCDVENSLQILSIIKLFLDMENIICVAAVDHKRLENAWLRKYSIKDKKHENDAKQYLDKIFQVRIGIPVPDYDEVEDFFKDLVDEMPPQLLEMFVSCSKRNPRSIKRMLNLIAYRKLLLNSDENQISATLWTLLEEIVGNEMSIKIVDIIRKGENSLGRLVSNNGNNWASIKQIVGKVASDNSSLEDLRKWFYLSHKLITEIHIDVSQLELDFDVLYSRTKESFE